MALDSSSSPARPMPRNPLHNVLVQSMSHGRRHAMASGQSALQVRAATTTTTTLLRCCYRSSRHGLYSLRSLLYYYYYSYYYYSYYYY
jgi:hypothetical protein